MWGREEVREGTPVTLPLHAQPVLEGGRAQLCAGFPCVSQGATQDTPRLALGLPAAGSDELRGAGRPHGRVVCTSADGRQREDRLRDLGDSWASQRGLCPRQELHSGLGRAWGRAWP